MATGSFTPYDPSAGGPSAAAQSDMTVANDNLTMSRNASDYNVQGQRNDAANAQSKLQLNSSLGANGQEGGTTASLAQANMNTAAQNQSSDLSSSFHRAQTDLQRNQVFASLGLILG